MLNFLQSVYIYLELVLRTYIYMLRKHIIKVYFDTAVKRGRRAICNVCAAIPCTMVCIFISLSSESNVIMVKFSGTRGYTCSETSALAQQLSWCICKMQKKICNLVLQFHLVLIFFFFFFFFKLRTSNLESDCCHIVTLDHFEKFKKAGEYRIFFFFFFIICGL